MLAHCAVRPLMIETGRAIGEIHREAPSSQVTVGFNTSAAPDVKVE